MICCQFVRCKSDLLPTFSFVEFSVTKNKHRLPKITVGIFFWPPKTWSAAVFIMFQLAQLAANHWFSLLQWTQTVIASTRSCDKQTATFAGSEKWLEESGLGLLVHLIFMFLEQCEGTRTIIVCMHVSTVFHELRGSAGDLAVFEATCSSLAVCTDVINGTISCVFAEICSQGF